MLLMAILSLIGCKEHYKEGDIVFQVSKSRQSPLIQQATDSKWSHCGIIVYKNGKPYVLEASNVVKLTDLDAFCKRGKGGKTKVMRYTNDSIKVKYKKYLGTPYDTQFRFDNGRYYCSELVYLIYKEQLGVELCKPKPLSEYNTSGLEKEMKRRGISSKSLFVAPSDLIDSPLLHNL